MSRILVTGGSGFIGSHVVDALRAAGHEPQILDTRPSPHHDDVLTFVGDIRRLDDVREALHGCDAVVHLAAAADVGQVAEDPVGAEELNARGTLTVLQSARELGVSRVVYASTIWVYSDVEAERVDEDTPLRPPAHLYTATKLAGELYCRSYAELYGLECTVLRFGIPYGPRARPAAVLPIFVAKALAGEPLTLAGGGEQTRRFVYVEDLAEGVVRGLAPAAANRTFNLVGDEDVSVRQIADTVGAVIGDVEVVSTEGRAGDFRGAEVCGRRAAEELGWRPRTCFAEGVRRYVDWHRQQAEPAAEPVPAPPARRHVVGAMLRGVAARRLALIVLVGLLAGAVASSLTHIELLGDPSTFLVSMMLLAVPVALVARIDWTRDRRDAVIVVGTMLVGAALAGLMWAWTGDLLHLARDHVVRAALLTLAGVTVLGVRQRQRQRAVNA
jgi:UDP-glucose 4-epimerase